MILFSASRREDMPAHRMDKILQTYARYQDAFWVLWTKNPQNIRNSGMDYKRMFLHLTITGFGSSSLEPGVPEPETVWQTTEGLIADGLDPALIAWRLDPLIPSDHLQSPGRIERMARRAGGMGITRCVTSFVTLYPSVRQRWPQGALAVPDTSTKRRTALGVREILSDYGITLYGCAQSDIADLVKPSKCIDAQYLSAVTGKNFSTLKDVTQRNSCSCTVSIDIGKYDRCKSGCLYCYATGSSNNSRQQKLDL